MFSYKSKKLLLKMRISPDKYYRDLVSKFGNKADCFCKIIDYFDAAEKVGSSSDFIKYCEHEAIDSNSELYDWLYEFYSNLCRYFDGGVFYLFKKKQAEWGAPRINIQRQDVPEASDVSSLNDPQIIYRGMSVEEHQAKDYAQSWTLDIQKAHEFANEVYSDEPVGIVVKTEIGRDKIIYFDANDSEKEIIIELGAVNIAVKI